MFDINFSLKVVSKSHNKDADPKTPPKDSKPESANERNGKKPHKHLSLLVFVTFICVLITVSVFVVSKNLAASIVVLSFMIMIIYFVNKFF